MECRALFPKLPHNEAVLDDQSTGDLQKSKNMSYLNDHPSRLYTECVPLEHWVIPRVPFIKNSLCMIEDLNINNNHPSTNTICRREVYAKTTLLQFYPYCTEDDLKINDSYWTRFMVELHKSAEV
jgi:hypothetical protein